MSRREQGWHFGTKAVETATREFGLDWQDEALCRNYDPEIWFRNQEEAVKICHRCPVEQICRLYSMRAREAYGTWGGIDEQERGMILGMGTAP